MITYLHGLLAEKKPPILVIEVQGIGYEVLAPMSTFYNLPEINTEITLLTHLSIRDDAHILYGFFHESERELFRSLIRINGVGPKLALSILSSMDLSSFIQCIHNNDIEHLKRIPGVGKKTAERLIVEMRDRLTGDSNDTINPPIITPAIKQQQVIHNPVNDAISALIALGYKPNDASRWVRNVAEEDLSSEQLIRLALQSAL
ncbi:MAG: Holliday junction branch migration protein RuvA [Thiomargarita sp.]|nr:Holliday junction branch migration protein RuvA [Thiomargarita sp.]